MEPDRFTERKTGELRKFHNLHTGADDWLFVPDELPPKWEFPSRLWPLLAHAKESLGTLNGFAQTLPNPDLLLHPLQTREAIASSSIEGTYVTPQQLLLYGLDPKEPDSAEGEVADWREVFNYSAALKLGCRRLLADDMPICGRLVKELHATLMSGVRGERKTPGLYRRGQVQIGAAGKYIPPPAFEVDRLMSNLEQFIHANERKFDPLVLCYLVHYQFEAIHPFNDGNGRIGRLLLSLMIFRWARLTMPWLYMSAFFEKYRSEYTDSLFRISTHGDWDSWVEFCLHGTAVQSSDAIRRCRRFNELREEYKKRIAKCSPSSRSYTIIEELFASTPVITIPNLAQRFGITYHTARADIRRLVKAGILSELSNARPRSFYAQEIMAAAYESPSDAEESRGSQDSPFTS